MYVNQTNNPVLPLAKVDAPSGYGLDNRFMSALDSFENFKRPCSGGNIEACENVKRVIIDWAKTECAKRIGQSNQEGRQWNDTLKDNNRVESQRKEG